MLLEKPIVSPPESTKIKWGARTELIPRAAQTRHALIVDRTDFDASLKNHAARAGIQITEGEQARVLGQNEDGDWSLALTNGTYSRTVQCRFLVDASGAGRVLAATHEHLTPPSLALSAQCAVSEPATSMVEACEHHWLWAAGKGGSMTVTAFLDPAQVTIDKHDLLGHFRHYLEKSSLLPKTAEVMGTIHSCDATTRKSKHLVGDRYINVGNAAFALDPLSSHGVQYALVSALQASKVVHSLLSQPENSEIAQRFYTKSVGSILKQSINQCAKIYAEQAAFCQDPFWTRHPEPILNRTDTPNADTPIKLCAHAKLQSEPVIRQNLVAEAEALTHPELTREIAFYSGKPIGVLMERYQAGMRVDALYREWRSILNPKQAMGLLKTLWENRVIVEAMK